MERPDGLHHLMIIAVVLVRLGKLRMHAVDAAAHALRRRMPFGLGPVSHALRRIPIGHALRELTRPVPRLRLARFARAGERELALVILAARKVTVFAARLFGARRRLTERLCRPLLQIKRLAGALPLHRLRRVIVAHLRLASLGRLTVLRAIESLADCLAPALRPVLRPLNVPDRL